MTDKAFFEKFNIHLNEAQLKAVENGARSMLLLAVPGSGKTTTLVTKVGYLIYEKHIPPENILTMTYTVAACHDMKRRFISFFGDEYADALQFRTINGVCATIINRYVRETGGEAFALVEDNSRLIAEAFRKVYSDFPDDSEIKDIQSLITYIKNMRLTAAETDKLKVGDRAVAPVFEEYNSILRSSHKMDYDDQMVFARTILLKYPSILDAFRRRFTYLCVDEAQDTSKIQHEIINILVGNSGRLFMVGDEDQSIYGFRAAFPEALMRFEEIYPGGEVMYLEQNYRSTPEIVALANILIKQNTERRQKRMLATRSSGQAVQRVCLNDRAEQYEYIARLAKTQSDIETAVLYRNNDSAVPLIDLLDRQNIPFRCRRGDSLFFSNRSVLGMVDIMQLALEPLNEELFMRVYYKLGFSIKRTDAQKAVERVRKGKSKNFFTALAVIVPEWLREGIIELSAEFALLPSDSASQAVSRIRYRMGYGGYVLRQTGDNEKLFLMSVLASREKDIVSLLDRLEQLKLIVSKGGDGQGCLILSTVHSSKGLEYDRVILIDAIDGILPSVAGDRQKDEERKAAMEEERRLFYVGITRSKKELLLMQYARQPRSLFIDECFPKVQKKKVSAAAKFGARAETSFDAGIFKVGMYVKHPKFGVGRITAISKELITVFFPKKGAKQLLLNMCIEKGLLEAVK